MRIQGVITGQDSYYLTWLGVTENINAAGFDSATDLPVVVYLKRT